MTKAAANNYLPALTEASIRNIELFWCLSQFPCKEHGWHNLYRHEGAAIEILMYIQECPTLGCTKHRPANNALSMTNFSHTAEGCLTNTYGRYNEGPIKVVHIPDGHGQLPETPAAKSAAPWGRCLWRVTSAFVFLPFACPLLPLLLQSNRRRTLL